MIKIFVLLLLSLVFVQTAYAATLPGDANSDNKVDGLDYIIWLNHYGQTLTGVINGNFNGDSVIDGIDYVIWLTNYGKAVTPTPNPNVTTLEWKPPQLVNPITINLGTGNTSNTLVDGQDYIIKLPSSRKNGYTKLIRGRNIVIVGGYITTPPTLTSTGDRRAIYLNGQTGTVHIEGVLIDGSGGGQADAIAIAAPNAIVQVQNVRAVGLRGGQNAADGYEHSDVIQPWGGVKELRVDRLSGSTNYQGLQIPQDLQPIGKSILNNINLWYDAASPNNGGYLLWFSSCTNAYPIELSEVYIVPKTGRVLGNSVWPDMNNSTCPTIVTNNQARWPSLPQITGSVKLGPPASGDFVPEGVAGLNYVSPGYK